MSRFCLVLLTLSLSFLIGCGGGNDPDSLIANANRESIQQLANLYGAYQARHGWVGPKDKDTFVGFIEAVPDSRLERMGIDPTDIAGLFTSPRDSREFKIRYGVKGGMGASAPVVFEEVGVDGMRHVAFTAMRDEEADSARYDLLWSGEGDNQSVAREAAPEPERP